MKKFEGYLLVSDLDGTLFGEGHTVPERNVKAIEYFIENGGYFTVATGRGMFACEKLIPDLPKNAPGILFNGAVLYNFEKREAIWEKGISSQNARSLIQTINKNFPDIPTAVFHELKMYSTIQGADFTQMRKMIEMDNEYNEYPPFPWYKMLCQGENEKLCEVEKYIRTLGYDEFQYTFSSKTLLEIIQKGVNKGVALMALSEFLEIPIENTIAAGDYYNDRELLAAAGTAVVPSNAPEDMKELADIIVGDNKNGAIADLIEKWSISF